MSNKKIIVTRLVDEECEMVRVKLNETGIFHGNEWDFYPGCHGSISLSSEHIPKELHIQKTLNKFNGSYDFFQQVIKAYQEAGFEVTEKKESYSYEEFQEG